MTNPLPDLDPSTTALVLIDLQLGHERGAKTTQNGYNFHTALQSTWRIMKCRRTRHNMFPSRSAF